MRHSFFLFNVTNFSQKKKYLYSSPSAMDCKILSRMLQEGNSEVVTNDPPLHWTFSSGFPLLDLKGNPFRVTRFTRCSLSCYMLATDSWWLIASLFRLKTTTK